jgi:hypothetical protein
VELLSDDDGAVLTARDYQGRHALHFAAVCGSLEVARGTADEARSADVSSFKCDSCFCVRPPS